MQIDLNDYEPADKILYQVHMEDGTWTKWITLDEMKTLNPRHIMAFISRQHYRKKTK